jgi:hypothetical protein
MVVSVDHHQQQTPCYSFTVLSKSIEESFVSIDRFEFQVAEELRVMRDDRVFEKGGYKSFEEYCNRQLSQWGGYRRVNQMLGAQLVVSALKGTEFDGAIKRESHARPLLRLVKSPGKLREAVAIACQDNPDPIADNFKKAVAIVDPRPQKIKSQEQLFLSGDKVKVNSQNHYRFNQKGEVTGDPENGRQVFVTFADNQKELIGISDLKKVALTEYTPSPRTYTEDELEEAIARAIQESQIGKMSELREKAEADAREELKAAQAIANQKALEVAKLQRQLVELEPLRLLEVENQSLRQRIQELENAMEERACQQWGNTFTKQAEKVINAEIVKTVEKLEPELHLRALSQSSPSNPREALKLIGRSLVNLAQALPKNGNLQQASALVLGVRVEEIPAKIEQLNQLPEAIACIKQARSWEEITTVGDRFPLIKQEVWAELSPQEREKVNQLKPRTGFSVGDRVSGSDQYAQLYLAQGTVTGFENDMVLVKWDGKAQLLQHRYEPGELRNCD